MGGISSLLFSFNRTRVNRSLHPFLSKEQLTHLTNKTHLLRLLHALLCGRAVKPHSNERHEPSHGDPDTADPDPSAADLPTPGPLVVGEVADGDLPLLVDVGDEGAAVVDAEVEDAVLVGGLEGDAEDGGVGGCGDGRQVEAVEGRQHAEFQLDLIAGVWDEGLEAVADPLGDLDLVVLVAVLARSSHWACKEGRYLQHRS